MANIIEQADAQIAAILSEWSILTTLLAVIIVAFVAYPIIYPEEADTHPLLLARQASISAVRKKKESAVYRSPEVAGDTPLKSGLNVKDAGAPRWAAGKDGDLRDVWREVQRGGSKDADGKDVPKGAIMTLLGRDEVVEHEVLHLSKEIQIMGEHFRENRVKRLAIYLPNSIEFLMSIFGRLLSILPNPSDAKSDLLILPSLRLLRPHSSPLTLQSPTPKSLRAAQRSRSGRFGMRRRESPTRRPSTSMPEAAPPDVGR